MKHSGFTLLEIMLVLLISSILSTVLYTSFFQTQNILNTIDGISTVYIRAIIMQRQMTRDLAGICVPHSLLEPPRPKKEESDLSNTQPQQPESSQQKSPEEQMQELKQRLSTVFNATTTDNRFASLRCMTNNPLDIFWSKSSGRPKPRIESVQYRLEKMTGNQAHLYRLIRQSSFTLHGQTEQKTVEHELINSITSMKIQYRVFYTPEKEQQQTESTQDGQQQNKEQKEEQEKSKLEELVFDNWIVTDMDDKDVRIRAQLPQYITISVSILNNNKKRSDEFVFTVPVAWRPFAAQEKKAQQEREKQLELQKKQQEAQVQEGAQGKKEQLPKDGRTAR